MGKSHQINTRHISILLFPLFLLALMYAPASHASSITIYKPVQAMAQPFNVAYRGYNGAGRYNNNVYRGGYNRVNNYGRAAVAPVPVVAAPYSRPGYNCRSVCVPSPSARGGVSCYQSCN